MALLDAVIPISNMAGKLQELESLFISSHKEDIRFILIHDVQDKRTSIELKALIIQYPDLDLVLVEGEFGGPGGARNAGIHLSESTWICFWDSDDLPNISNVMESTTKVKPDTEIIIGDFNVLDVRTNSIKSFSFNHFSTIEIGFNPGLWRMIFRNTHIKGIEFPEILMAEDQVFISRVAIPGRNLAFLNSVFYTYRTGQGGQLTKDKKALLDLQKSIELMRLEMKEQSGQTLKLSMLLTIKQIFTLAKRGGIQGLLISTKNIWEILRKRELLLSALFSITLIFRHKLTGK